MESKVKSVIYLTESQGFYREFCEAYINNGFSCPSISIPALVYQKLPHPPRRCFC